MGIPAWLRQKLHLPREMDKALDHRYKGRYVFCEHHESHAASAFFPSPFDEAAILTFDGVGEWATASFGVGRGNRIEITHEMHFPHSLGLLYSAFTYFTGFKVNSGEYKLMGLAPYGEPKYVDLIRKELIDLKDDGSLWLNMDYFTYCHGTVMTGGKFDDLFGGPAGGRKPRHPARDGPGRIDPGRHRRGGPAGRPPCPQADRHEKSRPGRRRGAQLRGQRPNPARRPFENIWIQPAAGDAGGALGAALFVWHQLLDKPRKPQGADFQQGSLLGPAGPTNRSDNFWTHRCQIPSLRPEEELLDTVADLIAGEKVIGWFQGRMEFGPRALAAAASSATPAARRCSR